MKSKTGFLVAATIMVAAFAGCSNLTDEPAGTGGGGGGSSKASGGSGGRASTGGSTASSSSTNSGGSSGGSSTAAGGSASTAGSSVSGRVAGSGGSSASGGSVNTGGSSSSGGASVTGGTRATGGTGGTTGVGGTGGASRGSGTGGVTGPGGTGAGGTSGVAGTTGASGSTRPDAGTGDSGSGGASGDLQPCPTTEACKILPLGDSITWGINYGGGYRIKLAIHAANDQKNLVYVGYDTANPPNATALGQLGTAKDKYVNKHEGHSGWTIQQDDDLVTGKSNASNDGVSYSGKKVVKDFGPHIVLVHLGTNDMYQKPDGAPDRLGTLIDHIVADAPNALVVVSNIIPFPSGASAVTTFNKAVPDVVKQHSHGGHVVFADQFSGFKTSDLGSDQVHPNEGGYEKMAVVWYGIIKKYLH